ncbi:Neuronal-specific septin-3 [Channa argus]|uniref:Neuronal-specific septin-3 n=3 Tax=Channa argus TaxID=215402 RepID=A0A6G1PC20_CHAAH|nr:Neuronal-specific septin-3 [Channa argus]
MSSDGQGAKQPSPVAKERRAKSITISNAKSEPKQSCSNETKHEILNQEALLHFTHPALRRSCPMMRRETGHQTYSKSQSQAATSDTPCFFQEKSKIENIVQDKQKQQEMNLEFTAIPKPKFNIKQQLEFLPSGATGKQNSLTESEGIKSINVVHREYHSVFDELPKEPSFNLQRKCSDYPSKRPRAQTAGFASSHQSEHMYSQRGAALPISPKTTFSTHPLCVSQSTASPNIETRRRNFELNSQKKVDTRFLSDTILRRPQEENSSHTGATQNIQSLQKQRVWLKAQRQTAQMNVLSSETQSTCLSKDYSCKSRDIDQKAAASQCANRLNRLKTYLVAPQTQEASRAASAECTISQTESSQKPAPQSQKYPLDLKQSPGQTKVHQEVKLSDTGLNKKDNFARPEHCVMPEEKLESPLEKSWSPSVAHRPFSTNRSGIISKGVLPSQPQHSVYQRPEETAALLQPQYSSADRAFIMDEPEDPYYVTMYYPGSVYVDMSDIVPPEVRPKPAVPAKPPNVGAPSPSSSFPPQGPGIGVGGGVSAPPPSGIPVPIGSHGPSLGGSVVHSVGHAAGLGGVHTATHSGGHGHGGSNISSGGSTLLGYIGIDTIIEQMRKKTMKTGFDFNIMVVGHSGLGKSTLVNTLFKSQVSRRSTGWARDEKIPKTVEIKAVSHVIEEGGVKMKLTVVDTPGFGDLINNDNCWEPISKFINEQYEKFLKEEVNITRKKRIPDTRVHCCLYFISPTGHSLRQLDIEFMKRLSHSVNIIPVIAKADTMTIEERQEFKQRVRKELEMSGIEFYPQKEFDEDMEDKSDNDKIREAMPFAVVGSDKEYQVNGKRVLGRKTAWGIVEVENPIHCEFAQLRDFLIRSHLQDLKEVTHNIHYETYRAKRLNENGGLHPISSSDTQESNL